MGAAIIGRLPLGRAYAATQVNATIFRVGALASAAGRQYATYYGPGGEVIVAGRDLAGGPWQLTTLPATAKVQDAHNGGWGGQLFQTVLDWLEHDGPRTLWIGVWSENLGAQRFYGRYGFEKVGEYLFPVGNTNDHEFILRRAKAAAAGD